MQIGVGVCEICCTSWQRPLCLVPYLFFSETCIACWFSPSLLFPPVRFASLYPALQCPVKVFFEGCVLPSSPSPCTWPSHALSTMLDKTPQNLRLPSLFSKVWLSYLTLWHIHAASPFPLCVNVSETLTP